MQGRSPSRCVRLTPEAMSSELSRTARRLDPINVRGSRRQCAIAKTLPFGTVIAIRQTPAHGVSDLLPVKPLALIGSGRPQILNQTIVSPDVSQMLLALMAAPNPSMPVCSPDTFREDCGALICLSRGRRQLSKPSPLPSEYRKSVIIHRSVKTRFHLR